MVLQVDEVVGMVMFEILKIVYKILFPSDQRRLIFIFDASTDKLNRWTYLSI